MRAHLEPRAGPLCSALFLIILLNNAALVAPTSGGAALARPRRHPLSPGSAETTGNGGPDGRLNSRAREKLRRRGLPGAPAAAEDGGSNSHLSVEETRDQSSGARNASQEAPPNLEEPQADESQPLAEDQSVTCPPDYEDQLLLAGEASANLTEEQAAAAGSLVGQLAGATGNGTGNELLGPAVPLNCVLVPGKKMIEVITTVITPILFSIIVVVGLLGNLVVMYVIREEKRIEKELTPTNLLILDLSLADLSFITCCIPFTGWDYYLKGQWIFGLVWCKANQYLIVVCALSSIYTLVLMSLDRFMAIVYPIKCISYRTSKNTLYAICIKWILILAAASPAIRMHGLVNNQSEPDVYKCRFLEEHYNSLLFQIVFFISSYLFPLVLIFCLYLALLNKLWYGSKPYGHKESSKMLESKKKVTWLVASIVVVFALCWCPIQVMLILMRIKSHKITATYVAIQVFAHTLGYMNSCVNPIVYAFASESFVNSFKRSPIGGHIYWLLCIGNRSRHNLQNHHHHHNNNTNNPNQLQQQQHPHQTQLTTFNANDYEGRSTNFVASHNNTTTIHNDLHSTNQNSYHPHPHHHLHLQHSSSPGPANEPAASYKSGCSSEIRQATPECAGTPRNESYNSTSNSTLVSQPCHTTTTTNSTASNHTADRAHLSVHQLGSANPQPQPQPPLNAEPSATLALEPRDRHVQQQLVAHMVSSGKQISHRCEPYKQELIQ